MSYQRFLRAFNLITTYLLVFSLLSSPTYTRSSATAAATASANQQAASASVSLTKSDSLLVDQDGDGEVEAGDTLRYTLTARNTGSVDASGAALIDVLEGNLSLLPGSLRTTPLALAQSLDAPEDSAPVPFTLQGADFDGDPLSYTIVTSPVNGVIGGTAPNLTYQPSIQDYFGSDSLTFQVCDAAAPANCDTAAVAINIPSVNDAPSFTAGAGQTVLEESGSATVTGWATAISAGPVNESGQALTFLVNNDNSGLFAVQPTVSTDGTLHFATAPNAYGQAVLSVSLHDDGGTALGGSDTSAAQTVTIDVLPVNDAPAFTAGPAVIIGEDAGLQTLTGWATGITAGPNETGQELTFEVISNSSPMLFAAAPSVSSDGTLTFQTAENALGTAQISLRLVDDGGTANGGVNTSAPQSFQITVQEANDAPVVAPASFDVEENSLTDTLVGTVTYTDPDAGQTHEFAITGGDPSGAFAIDPSSGVIRVANPAPLDFETTPVFHLTVTVTDNGAPAASGSAVVDVNLLDANDAPSVNSATFSLPEASKAGDVVGTVTIIDQDSGQTHHFTIAAGNTGNAFGINDQGQITVFTPAALDFETKSTYTLTVEVTDNGSPAKSASGTVTINLSNSNEAPSVNSAAFSVPEYSLVDTPVGTVTVSDPDFAQTFTFAITGGNTGGAFAIDNDGSITVANSGPLQFNINPTFTLTVEVTDSGTPAQTGTGTITVHLTNVNDAPVVSEAAFSVDENSLAETSVGTVTYTDLDAGQAHAFSITGGNEGGAFAINPATGEITVAGDLDYEARLSYTLVVTVGDDGTPPLQGSANITVSINNLNEPPVVGPSSFDLPENSPVGTSVGTLDVDDPETNQAHTFAILSGNTDGAFAVDGQGQITVANSAPLDYETLPAVTLQIEVRDSGSPASVVTSALTVNLTDVNETPAIDDAAFTIDENLPNGRLVGVLPIADPDRGQTYTFVVTNGDPGGAFSIDGSGNITVAKASLLNFEVTPSFTLAVKVTDSGSPALSDTAVVTVNLNDVNEAPSVQSEEYQTIGNTMLQVAGASSAASPVVFINGNLLSNDSDPDSGNQLHTELNAASPTAVVTVAANGEFTYLPPAGVTTDSFTYRVVDQDGLSTVATVSIELLGRVWYVKNDAAPGGLGRSTDPFDTLAEAQAASAPGDTVYVSFGSGTAAGQDAGITLKDNQRLVGAGSALNVPVSVNGGPNPTPLLPADQKPVLTNFAPGGSAVTVASGSTEVLGLNIAAAGNAIDATYAGAGAGTLTIQNNIISAAGAEGIDINANSTGEITAVVRDNDIRSTGNGFDMIVTGGSAQLDFSGNRVASGANGVWVNKTGGVLVVSGFANNTISGETVSNAAVIGSAVFDAVPGGAMDSLNLGTYSAGTPADPVGGIGLAITNGQGKLYFSGLDITANGTYGLQVSGAAGAGSSGLSLSVASGQGSVTVNGGTAVGLSSLSIDAPNLAIVSVNSPFEGVKFVAVSGSLSTTSGSAITNSQWAAFLVNGGSADLVYNGVINQSVGRTVEVSNMIGGSVAFNGAINGGGTGVLLQDNAGTPVAFHGGLTLNTGANPAFTSVDTGWVEVTGPNNSLATTTGTALSVSSSTIGSGGLNFRSVNVNGAPVGIDLLNTGSEGGLTVTGTGSAGTGGSILNTSDDAVQLRGVRNITLNNINITNAAATAYGLGCGVENATDCSSAVDMYNAANVTLNGLNVIGSGQMGISGYLVNGLTITNTTVVNAGNSNDEYALLLHNPSGTVLVQDSSFSGMYETGVRLYKYDSSVLNLILRRAAISNNNPVTGEDGFQFKLINAVANMLVEDSTFTQLKRDGIDGVYQGSALLNLTVSGNTFESSSGNGGILIAGSDSARGLLTLDGNTIRNTVGTAVSLVSAQFSELNAKVTNNRIEHPAPPAPQAGEGVRLSQDENSTMTVLVSNNVISGTSLRDIAGYARLASSSGSLHIQALGNTAGMPLTGLVHGMDFGVLSAGHTLCLDIEQNNASGNGTAGIRVNNQAGVFQLEGAAGNLNTDAAAAFINSRNISNTAAVAAAGPGRTFAGMPEGACRMAVGASPLPSSRTPVDSLAKSGACAPGLARLVSPSRQAAGETLQVNIGTLPAGKSVTATFDVVVADPLPSGVFQVSNQALLRGSNFADVVSDDPATVLQTGDPTITLLYSAPTTVDDLFTTNEDAPLTVPAPGVLENDLASSGYTLHVASNTLPASGSLNVTADGGLSFTPAQDVNGDLTFTYVASDGGQDSNPGMATLRVLPVNDAPVLDSSGSMQLNPVGASSLNNPGTLIRDLLDSAGDRISEVDAGALEGVAVVGADVTHGSWQYTIDGGLTWQDLGLPSASAARLLASDTDTRLRFISDANFAGLVDPAITFRAWDRTSGTNGGTADVSTNGGVTSFSTAEETASIEVYLETDLKLSKTSSENPTLAGNTIVFTLAVTNQGPNTAQDLTVTDPLPGGINLVSVGAGCSEDSGVVTCEQASLDPGATASFDVTVEIPTDYSGSLVNTASVTSLTPDTDIFNNAASVTVVVTGQIVVIDPDDPTDPEDWNKPIFEDPDCGDTFMGEYSNETVTLTLDELPQHTEVTVEFDLVIIRSWDGNQESYTGLPASAKNRLAAMGVEVIGPDLWSMHVDEQPVITTTFSNWDAYGFHQAYPGGFPGGDFPARTGAKSTNTMCYAYLGYSQDTVYHMRYTIPHAGSSLRVDFSASGLQPIEDESWGLDNMKVEVSSGADPTPFKIYLPVVRR